ncbi:MAG: tyrosine-type recombinase/integrase [Candidatus Marinimicrobia bacterium]|nr:tyrosine-type recombinase/integrase [Candidatus Neomarinimicrobiota bacterium]
MLRATAGYPNKVESGRIRAIIVILYDTGLRAQELCSLRTEDVNWNASTILVRETKGGDHRYVGLGANAARCIDTYLRKRKKRSGWLFETLAGRQLTTNALKLALRRAFDKAGVPFHGSHGFRRGFAIAFLANNGSPEDLKQLAGWRSHAMVARYTRADASRRAIESHKQLSPGDRLRS